MTDKMRVLEFIQQNSFVSTQQLCQEFRISESTARRLLDKLDSDGQITRLHGGAMPIHDVERMTDFQFRNRLYKEQKIAIARRASELIQEHDTIIMAGGTTVYEMCQFIDKMDLTIVTNSILVLNELRYSQNVRIILLGGLYNYNEEEVGGLMGNEGLSRLRADHFFMGASGFDERFGFMTTEAPIELYVSCIEASVKVSILADSSKYMRGGSAITAKLDQVDYLFTDKGLSGRAKQAMEAQGIQVVLSDE